HFDPQQRSVTWAHAVPGCFAPNATMQYCCGAYDWFRSVVTLEEKRLAKESGRAVHDILADEAAQAPIGSAGVIFLPQLLGERAPFWNPNVRGAFLGLSGTTSRAEIVRAVFEGLSCHLALLVDLVNTDRSLSEITLIGGGAENDFWAQMIADVTGFTAVVPEETREANSMGAAVIAGVGAGIFPDFTAIGRFLHEKKRFSPDLKAHKCYKKCLDRYSECYHAAETLY
ncbi:MAG: xylulokinase, partial [Lentisphaeria bacterium]|nr:xylulokinase [Lentisphaeria bacterium]